MKAVTLLRFVACAETWVHSYSPETKIVIRGIPEVFKAVVSAGKKRQESLGTFTGSFTLFSRRVVPW